MLYLYVVCEKCFLVNYSKSHTSLLLYVGEKQWSKFTLIILLVRSAQLMDILLPHEATGEDLWMDTTDVAWSHDTNWFPGFFFLILSLIVEVCLLWKLQTSLITLSRRTCTISGWLNTFWHHYIETNWRTFQGNYANIKKTGFFFFFFLPELDLINPSSKKLVGNTIQNTSETLY